MHREGLEPSQLKMNHSFTDCVPLPVGVRCVKTFQKSGIKTGEGRRLVARRHTNALALQPRLVSFTTLAKVTERINLPKLPSPLKNCFNCQRTSKNEKGAATVKSLRETCVTAPKTKVKTYFSALGAETKPLPLI
jgi:hypothetical protein